MNTVAVAASVEIAENFVSPARRDCYSKKIGVKALEKLGGEALVLEPRRRTSSPTFSCTGKHTAERRGFVNIFQ